MLYKPGDVVHVREDLENGKHYDNFTESIESGGNNSIIVVPKMLDFAGRNVTIEKAEWMYRIAEDEDDFWWTDDMFTGLACNVEFDRSDFSVSDLLF